MLLSKENIILFITALRKEPVQQVFKNVINRILNRTTPVKKLNNGVFYNIDFIAQQNSVLIVLGWFTSNLKIKANLIYNDLKVGIDQAIHRPDVIKVFDFLKKEDKVGFVTILENVENISAAFLHLKTEQGITKINLSTYSPISSFNNLPFHIQYQIRISCSQNKEVRGYDKNLYLISIITPTYNTDPIYLNECIYSVLNQSYKNWELILYDDASTDSETIKCLNNWEKKDNRIKIIYGNNNLHISGANNQAISRASGDYIGFLDHDDKLHSSALHKIALAIHTNPSLEMIYTDEDKIDVFGNRSGPYFKPAFSIDHIRSNNFMCHFLVLKKSLGDSFGWFKHGLEGAQDYDCILEAIDRITPEKIIHIPEILYHWRMIKGSTAWSFDEKEYALKAGKTALELHLARNKISGKVLHGEWKGAYRIQYSFTPTIISIIIPFKDEIKYLKNCIKSIIAKTNYPKYEILLINNNSKKNATYKYLHEIVKRNKQIKVFDFKGAFNFSKINNFAVTKAKGEHILLLNNDTEIISSNWLSNMAEYIHRPEIGAVGAKLLYRDNTIQHAGVVTGIGGSAGHLFKGQANIHHYFFSDLVRNVSACTGACLLIKKSLYQQIGGLDEINLKIAYNDIDLCLKIRKAGYLITYTPHCVLYHYESKSRGYEDTPEKIIRHDTEKNFLKNKWKGKLLDDIYFNPNFSRNTEFLSLKFNSI